MPFIYGWILNGIYLLILIAVAPILIYRRMAHGKYRRGWNEKLTGRLTRQKTGQPCLWFHAVSVGEVLQLQKVLDESEKQFPEAELFITVTTETGYDVAREKYPRHTVSFFPLDFSWAINQALAVVQPDVIVLVELELWPNLILSARRRRIPLVLINGRMGARSFAGYSRIKPLMSRLLQCFDVLAVQAETYADRLRTLGAPPDKVIVTGNIKFDRAEVDRQNPRTTELRQSFQIAETDFVFIAGSTQDPEESFALDAWLALRNEFPQLQLIIVPRHKERFDEVAVMIQQRGCELLRRSEIVAGTTHDSSSSDTMRGPRVRLLDTLGELGACWGIADIAFVGGSLTNRGGQNMIEPAGYGAAVLFGPNTWYFKDVTEALLLHKAACVITGALDLQETVHRLLLDPDEVRRLGETARSFVAAQRGATERTVNLIAQALEQRDPDSSQTEATRGFPYWTMLSWILFGVVMVFITRRAIQLWESAPPQSIQIQPGWLVLAGFFYFLGWLPSVWFWNLMLGRFEKPLDWWTALRAYYVGHVGKYIPGKALVLVIRGALAKAGGVNPLVAGVTAAYETLVFMATGAAIALALSPMFFSPSLWERLAPGLSWVHRFPLPLAAIVVLATFASTPFSALLFTRVGQKALSTQPQTAVNPPSISAALISLGVIITTFGWASHALSLGCVLQSMSSRSFDLTQFPIWIGACALSTVGGFVVLLAPGGIGVREGLLIEVLKDQPQIGPAVALIAAGLLRVIWFITELITAGIFWIMGSRDPRPHQ